MSESPIELRGKGGGVVFQGTQKPPGGGSQPGAVRVLKHDFDFTQAAALNSGVTVFTPAVGDYLLDAWIETDDPGGGGNWVADGMNEPLADVGVIAAGAFVTNGFFGTFVGNPPNLANATWNSSNGKWAFISSNSASVCDLFAGAIGAAAGGSVQPPLLRFLTTDPISLVLSADGTVGGGAFDGSAGASTLYLVVSTPGTTP